MSDPFERAVERAEAAAERDDAERRQRFQERWRRGQRKGFRIHATVFVAVQLLIFAVWAIVWLTGGTGYPWFVFPLLAWGAGLAAHYAAVRDNFKAPTGK
jgi:Flp pilus assembly protein TadB